MTAPMYRLTEFVDDLRAITAETLDPRAIVVRVGPLARDLALTRTWLVPRHYECDAEQGFGAHLLHEEPDHRLAVFAGAWLARIMREPLREPAFCLVCTALAAL